MDNCTHDIRLANWKDIICQCQNRPTDMNCKQWLAENNINEKQYYYWLRKIRRSAYQEMQANQLPAPTEQRSVVFAELPFMTGTGTGSAGCSSASQGSSSRPDVLIRTPYLEIGMFNSASGDLIRSLLKELNHA